MGRFVFLWKVACALLLGSGVKAKGLASLETQTTRLGSFGRERNTPIEGEDTMATKRIDVCTMEMNLAELVALMQNEAEVLLTMGNQTIARISSSLNESKNTLKRYQNALKNQEPLPEGFWLD